VEGQELAVGGEDGRGAVDVEVDATTDPHRGGLRVVEVGAGEGASGGLGDRYEAELRLELLEGAGHVEAELPHRRTPQRGQVPAHPEGSPQVAGDSADVGARRAPHRDVDVHHVSLVADL